MAKDFALLAKEVAPRKPASLPSPRKLDRSVPRNRKIDNSWGQAFIISAEPENELDAEDQIRYLVENKLEVLNISQIKIGG